jgi:ABC-2 type transport system permease protein
MNTLTIAGTSLRRYLRDRSALFFVIVLPVLVIVILGTTIRGFAQFRIAVVDQDAGALGVQLTNNLKASPSIDMHHYNSASDASTAVRRGEVALAVVIPPIRPFASPR